MGGQAFTTCEGGEATGTAAAACNVAACHEDIITSEDYYKCPANAHNTIDIRKPTRARKNQATLTGQRISDTTDGRRAGTSKPRSTPVSDMTNTACNATTYTAKAINGVTS